MSGFDKKSEKGQRDDNGREFRTGLFSARRSAPVLLSFRRISDRSVETSLPLRIRF